MIILSSGDIYTGIWNWRVCIEFSKSFLNDAILGMKFSAAGVTFELDPDVGHIH